jgi:SAM-dependent methyltransferase
VAQRREAVAAMIASRALRTPPPELAEAWWPLCDVAPTGSRWHADHVQAGWWDPGDLHRTRLRHAAALVDELLASLPQDAVAAGARVLELGCGPGSGLQELARRWPCELHAWDASAAARAAARDLACAATVHDAAAPPLPLAGGAVDVVWAPRCFARGGGDWSALLAEAHRVLTPGGLLVAVLAGPGAWAWEARRDAWEEELTGMLVLGLDRPDERGGPICFTSRWWLREHWGRGFELVVMRPAGVAMVHPRQGFGLAVWRRRAGAPVAPSHFAAVAPGDRREGRAFHRQLELADAEARAHTTRRGAALAAAQARSAALARAGAADDHPRVRDARAAVDALEEELRRLRARPGPAAPLRALGDRLREARRGSP